MKTFLFRLVLALAALGAAPLRAEAPPLFSPEPPEPAAAALVETYLPLLVSGQYEQALALNDVRGMRQYLLERRLNDLKAKNPELTAQEIDGISAQLQVNDLNPARLQAILLDMMQKSAFEGLTWRIRGFAPAPNTEEGYLASIDARTPDGKERPVLLGLKKLGEQWMISPAIIEELGRKVVAPGVQRVPPPEQVAAAVDAFWKRWQAGELNEAYGMLGEDYRGKVPLLAFLQQAQDFIAQIGAPVSWKIVQCRVLAPDTLGLGVDVQGSTALKPTIMVFQKTGDAWAMAGCQFRMPVAREPAPAIGPAAPNAFRTDLRPHLAPAADSAEPEPQEWSGNGATPAPAKPAAPLGPDAPDAD